MVSVITRVFDVDGRFDEDGFGCEALGEDFLLIAFSLAVGVEVFCF